MIDLFKPFVPYKVKAEVLDTLNSRWIGQGPKVDLFEKRFQEKFKTKYSVALNSGSAALETAYELVGIQPGDEVITTPLTCTATNIPLLRMGAKIVWADIKRDTLCVNPKDILSKITPKTKAIVNVHLGGIENDLGKMPVPVIADACQALGVFSGDYVCNSFQAIKHITTGDGGMLSVNNQEQYRYAKLSRWFGIDREKKIANNWQAYQKRAMTFDIEVLGYKRQMTDIAAAMGIAGLKYYDYVIEHRKMIFELYKKLLKGVPGIKVVDGEKNTYWLCTVLVENRDDFAAKMFECDIDTNLVQIRNDVYKIFGGRVSLPVMDEVEGKYISLPLTMETSIENVMYICDCIRSGW
jgi:dTDP-4-amino-4,6-dideoxygalactose transaminase